MGEAHTDKLGIPVPTRATAGEDGAWGIARLAEIGQLFQEGERQFLK